MSELADMLPELTDVRPSLYQRAKRPRPEVGADLGSTLAPEFTDIGLERNEQTTLCISNHNLFITGEFHLIASII